MHFESRYHWSSHLGRDMHFNKYGHSGKPIIVFPSSGGSKDEFADFGMIDTIRHHINSGRMMVYTPSSIDQESWLAQGKSPHDMASAHNQYDKYIIEEFIPLVKHESQWAGKMATVGCSMGAYHAMNFGLRHPDVFDVVIAMSGVYDVRFFTGDFGTDIACYENSPIDYLYQEEDSWFLDQYRNNAYIASVGQGAWEGPHIDNTKRLEGAFNSKSIGGWFDYWGSDVPHDWPAWRKQFPYFIDKLVEQDRM